MLKNNKLLIAERKFFIAASKVITKHPYLVIIAMHEFSRNLYDVDPYIPFKEKNHYLRLLNIMQKLTLFLDASSQFGNYDLNLRKEKTIKDPKIKSGIVYGNLWKELSYSENLRTLSFLKKRFKSFKKINFNSFFKNKLILDAGCGNGRYSFALANLNPKKVIGIDFGNLGLSVGKKTFKYKNLELKQANVLKIPYKDNSFDFVLSNGVIHHTEDFKKGIQEIVRVCKPGGDIYIYLYGKGGLFWSSRKKMNRLMKKIPQEYTKKILDEIGMPTNRWIFQDNWYVPIERHNTYEEVIKILNNLGVSKIEISKSGMPTDLHILSNKYKYSEDIWGNGEVRLLVTK